MGWKDNILVSLDDISVYYNVIEMVSPRKILDIGMFLKRIGAVSRKNMNVEIKDKVILDGVDYMPDLNIPVMNNVYTNQYSIEEFEDMLSGERGVGQYDLVVMLYPESAISIELEKRIWNTMAFKARYILTNLEPQEERNRRILLPSNAKDAIMLSDKYVLFVLN